MTPPASIEPVARTGPETLPLQAQLSVYRGRGVEDGGEHDRERSRDGPDVAGGCYSGNEGHAGEPEADAEDPPPADPLVRQEPESDQQREDRDGRLGDRRHTRVDVLLAPGDEPEREGGVEYSEHERLAPGGPEVGAGLRDTDREGEIAEQNDAGDQGAARHQRPGREPAVDTDLDEQVRGAPHGGESQDEGPVPARHGLRLPVLVRASPVARAVPPRMSTRPTSAVVVTASSRKMAP